MSEPLRVTCLCGYENWVPAEKLGQVVACFVCGQELDLSAPPAEAAGEAQGGTPVTLPSPSGPPARNPFEADEPERETRAKVQYAPPASPAPPRPRSPFEADDAEAETSATAEEKLVAGPFSLKAEPEPRKGPTVYDQMETLRPRERRDKHVVVHTVSPHDAPTGEKCGQCGRDLRGAWDRITIEGRVLCYVCSNQATHELPIRMQVEAAAKREARDADYLVEPVQSVAPSRHPNHATPDSYKTAALWLAVGTLGLAFVIWLTGWGTPDPASISRGAAAQASVDMPRWVTYVVWVWRMFAGLMVLPLALYLTLDGGDRLPHERFLPNMMYLFAVVGLLLGLAVAAWIAWYLLSPIFIAGKIWFMMVGVVIALVQFWLLIRFLDFTFREFAWFYFVYLPLSQAIVYVSGMFFQWGLYSLAT